MTNEQIARAAKIVKIVRLARNPMMDAVSIKLNCGPTYDEIKVAERWYKAFELVQQQEARSDYALAQELDGATK